MDEYSRIIIEEYCMKYPKTKKEALLSKLMMFVVYQRICRWCSCHNWFPERKNADLQEALEDLYEFMIGY